MFHDPNLTRTTDFTGEIRKLDWNGVNGMQHARTKKEPKQAIPTFSETVALLMLPENRHVKFNVDVKIQNDPGRLFKLMHEIISAQEDWETVLAPRILLGLWHPRFIQYAKTHLPYLRRSFIGINLYLARNYFWNHCDAFSINFAMLTTADGQKFMKEAKDAGKQILVWTVNEPQHMMEAVRWGVDCIITDFTNKWLDLRAALALDYDTTSSKYGRTFLWTTWTYYSPVLALATNLHLYKLQSIAGPLDGDVAIAA